MWNGVKRKYEITDLVEYHGPRYKDCYATVTLEIWCNDQKTENITVKYPIQNGKHLTPLIMPENPNKRINHSMVLEISKEIKKFIEAE